MSIKDVESWRRQKRIELIAVRQTIAVCERKRIADEVADVLNELITIDLETIVSLYWPIQNELNLREWMLATYRHGARIALPVVVAKSTALEFREWTPECKMESGIWNIPVPIESAIVKPTVVITPLVGYDPACFRLGYGGGFFDRTLDSLFPRPYTIGVGHPSSAITTIHPQPHDIPMDVIVTGKNSVIQRSNHESPL